jgi:hypothetical protein
MMHVDELLGHLNSSCIAVIYESDPVMLLEGNTEIPLHVI